MKETGHKAVLRVKDLKVHYPIRSGFFGIGERKTLKAVDGVSLELFQGETLGIVGESGCGKSSLGKAIIRLVKSAGGSVEINGRDFLSLSGVELRRARTDIQMVFQDPYASLDPRMTVFNILAEPLNAHRRHSRVEVLKIVEKYLELVGLRPQSMKRYPHEFSGGQRQRIAVARALVLQPKIIIADEPVSSLDVSVQAQILNLLKEVKGQLGLSMLFVSHNLAVVKYIADRIAVMYLGKVVEIASKDGLYKQPLHPYTKALVSAVPIPDPNIERSRQRIPMVGEIPSPIDPPKGCAFHTRCPVVMDRCRKEQPAFKGYDKQSRFTSCFEVEKNSTVH